MMARHNACKYIFSAFARYGGHGCVILILDKSHITNWEVNLDGVISGSFVVQFFDDDFWKGSDLDIYVEREVAAIFGTYLARKEGYRFEKSSTTDDEYHLSGIYKVWIAKAVSQA